LNEKAILSSILKYGRFVEVPIEYFTRKEYRQVYQIFQSLEQENAPIDLVTVQNRLKNDVLFDALIETDTVDANQQQYVKDLQKERREELKRYCADRYRESLNGNCEGEDSQEILAKLNELDLMDSGGNFPFAGAHTLKEIAEMVIPPPSWIAKGLCLEKRFNIYGGSPGSGKSYLVATIALCAAAGKPVYYGDNEDKEPKKVLYVGMEGGELLIRRLQALGRGYKLFGKKIPFTLQQEDLRLYEERNRRLFLASAKRGEFDFVVFDPFQTCFGLSEQTDDGWIETTNFLTELTEFTTVNVIHHQTKPFSGIPTLGNLPGGDELGASVDLCIMLVRNKKEFTAHLGKVRDFAPSDLPLPLKMEIHQTSGSTQILLHPPQNKKDSQSLNIKQNSHYKK
jgi:hypothetical protein